MASPIGEPPSMQEFISKVKSELFYLNLEEKETDENYIYVLQGEIDSDNIRIEFDEPNTEERERASGTKKEKVWNNMTYRVFINGSNPDGENRYHFDRRDSYLKWENEILRFLKSISGAINKKV